MVENQIRQPVIVLVRPQMGENIGAVARAMANFGLGRLRLVAPRDGWPNAAAEATSSGALEWIEVSVFETLSEALADISYAYGTTARARDMAKPVLIPSQASLDAAERSIKALTAFVFGPERTGLENDEVALCHGLITVPTDSAFSSLNLGQCVLLMAYEISQSFKLGEHQPREHQAASQADFDGLFERLESALETKGFFTEANLRPKVTRNIRTMLMRGELSEQEVRTYHGILTALLRGG